MGEKRTSVFENSLIWFGAAVSIAEILTGTYFAPLGFAKGLAAILTGHVIGCLLLFAAGLIGGRARKSAMETVKMSFGQKGGLLFCVLNVLQLVGWTGIMIYDGALAADGLWDLGNWVWCLVIGALITLWILVGVRNLGKVNTVVMAVLFVTTIVLSVLIFGKGGALAAGDDSLSFGAAVELSVAMPLSWLPLISDYTRTAEKPGRAAAASAVVYGVVSCWMYLIGMGAALFTGESDVGLIMARAGLGAAGLVIVVLSTVTTTFLDAYSAGVSTESLSPRIQGKWMAVAAAVLGTVGAIVFPMDNITDFLYLIGSVFAPMIAVQIADFYILHRDKAGCAVDVRGLVLWAVGFVAYRLLMQVDLPLGSTIPDIALTVVLCVVADKLFAKAKA
ncbi:putative hydroxymethylpyrimidine transporter CytX [Ruthenibacterium sp. TH_2024_36131]|uniref:putative hydroxymethylpyrimidine transporter CytX n=1 Tax=Owariibacterium komagatae TaxID=3136601 RepID=UPI0038B3A7A4